jgi:hypothetical protein
MKEMVYDQAAKFIEKVMEMIFGAAESLAVNDTYQFEDYSKCCNKIRSGRKS